MEVEGVIKLNIKQVVAWILIVGALNWGLVGLLNINPVETILGSGSMLSRAVYIVVGLAGAYKAYVLVSKAK